MRKVYVSAMALLLAVTMLFSLVSCGEKSEIKALISDYETACNDLDFNRVLELVDPSVSSALKLAAGIVGAFSDTDAEELFEKLSDLLSDGKLGGNEFFSTVSIEVKEITVEEDTATVSAVITYEIGGEELESESTFYCVCKDDQWYISSYSLI